MFLNRLFCKKHIKMPMVGKKYSIFYNQCKNMQIHGILLHEKIFLRIKKTAGCIGLQHAMQYKLNHLGYTRDKLSIYQIFCACESGMISLSSAKNEFNIPLSALPRRTLPPLSFIATKSPLRAMIAVFTKA